MLGGRLQTRWVGEWGRLVTCGAILARVKGCVFVLEEGSLIRGSRLIREKLQKGDISLHKQKNRIESN